MKGQNAAIFVVIVCVILLVLWYVGYLKGEEIVALFNP